MIAPAESSSSDEERELYDHVMGLLYFTAKMGGLHPHLRGKLRELHQSWRKQGQDRKEIWRGLELMFRSAKLSLDQQRMIIPLLFERDEP